MKENKDFTGIVKFQTQFSPDVPDINRDGKRDSKDRNIACNWASKKMITDCGFKTVDASGRIDVMVYYRGADATREKKLIKATTFQQAVDQLHRNCDEGKPTLVAVNRGPKDVNNANEASNHYVVIVGRFYNTVTGKYEYRFYDPGTSYPEKGTDESQFFTLGPSGSWEGVSKYCGLKYIITEIRPTLS